MASGSIWRCEDCGWRWPLADVPSQDSECDACGGEMAPEVNVCDRCGFPVMRNPVGKWVHASTADSVFCGLVLTPSADVPACCDEDPAQPATLAACYPGPPEYPHPEGRTEELLAPLVAIKENTDA